MTTYRISNSTSGATLGTYEGETALDAYRAMMADAGYTTEDEQGRPLDEIPTDILVREARPISHGSLRDYRTGDYIRPATAEERAASLEAAERDGGRGVIEVDGRPVYVED